MVPLPHWTFSVSEGMGKDCSMFHKHVADDWQSKLVRGMKNLFPPYGVNCHF